jgi:hypothetical protein
LIISVSGLVRYQLGKGVMYMASQATNIAVVGGTDADHAKIDVILKKYEGQKGSLIPILQDTQDLYNYLPGKLWSISPSRRVILFLLFTA